MTDRPEIPPPQYRPPKYRPARIEIECDGVRAVLEGDAHRSELPDFWQCDDPQIKRILDGETAWCIYMEEILESPSALFISNWALKAGRLVAERLDKQGLPTRIIKEEPYEIYEEGWLGPDAII